MEFESTSSFCVLRDAGEHWRHKSGPRGSCFLKGFPLSWVGCPLESTGAAAISWGPQSLLPAQSQQSKHRQGHPACHCTAVWERRCTAQAAAAPPSLQRWHLLSHSFQQYLVQQKGPLAGQAPGVIHNSRDVPVWDREPEMYLHSSFCCQQLPLPATAEGTRVFFYPLSTEAPSGIRDQWLVAVSPTVPPVLMANCATHFSI